MPLVAMPLQGLGLRQYQLSISPPFSLESLRSNRLLLEA